MIADSLFLRLVLAVLAGALIGAERQWHHKTAGLKTHALVTVGAAAFAVVSQLGLGPGSNPVQIAAGVVAGIGFIGGGVIMRRGGSVQGINTAATLWASGGLGLALGGGHFAVARTLLLAVLTAQLPLRWLASFIDKHSGARQAQEGYRVLAAFDASADPGVRAVLAEFAATHDGEVTEQGEKREGASGMFLETRLKLPANHAREVRLLVERLASIAGVARAEWSRSPDEERD